MEDSEIICEKILSIIKEEARTLVGCKYAIQTIKEYCENYLK